MANNDNHEVAQTVSTKWTWAIGWMFAICVALWVLLVSRVLFTAPPPAEFLRVRLLTPVVQPTGKSVAGRTAGSVRLEAWVESPLDPACLVSTQYFIEFADGSMAKLPGMRITTRGELKHSVYEASVPITAPPGRAHYFIRDIYNCGIQARRVETPRLPFMVVPHLLSGASDGK